jgi:hypothetical protein
MRHEQKTVVPAMYMGNNDNTFRVGKTEPLFAQLLKLWQIP